MIALRVMFMAMAAKLVGAQTCTIVNSKSERANDATDRTQHPLLLYEAESDLTVEYADPLDQIKSAGKTKAKYGRLK